MGNEENKLTTEDVERMVAEAMAEEETNPPLIGGASENKEDSTE